MRVIPDKQIRRVFYFVQKIALIYICNYKEEILWFDKLLKQNKKSIILKQIFCQTSLWYINYYLICIKSYIQSFICCSNDQFKGKKCQKLNKYLQ